jgi:hypothetical protein
VEYFHERCAFANAVLWIQNAFFSVPDPIFQIMLDADPDPVLDHA